MIQSQEVTGQENSVITIANVPYYVPIDFFTKKIIHTPVTMNDGETYEEETIIDYIENSEKGKAISPVNKEVILDIGKKMPNHNGKRIIDQYLKEHPEYRILQHINNTTIIDVKDLLEQKNPSAVSEYIKSNPSQVRALSDRKVSELLTLVYQSFKFDNGVFHLLLETLGEKAVNFIANYVDNNFSLFKRAVFSAPVDTVRLFIKILGERAVNQISRDCLTLSLKFRDANMLQLLMEHADQKEITELKKQPKILYSIFNNEDFLNILSCLMTFQEIAIAFKETYLKTCQRTNRIDLSIETEKVPVPTDNNNVTSSKQPSSAPSPTKTTINNAFSIQSIVHQPSPVAQSQSKKPGIVDSGINNRNQALLSPFFSASDYVRTMNYGLYTQTAIPSNSVRTQPSNNEGRNKKHKTSHEGNNQNTPNK